MMFEYIVVNSHRGFVELNLNSHARSGWELVNACSHNDIYTLIFKRIKEDDTP